VGTSKAQPGVRKILGEAEQFFRFCIVGSVGFAVDALVLLVMTKALRFDPIYSRFVSFPTALLFTLELNRRWAFRGAPQRKYITSLILYSTVQAFGFFVNIATYSLLYIFLPVPYNAPLMCLGLASALAMAVNFIGLRLGVFRRRREE
jgi:putative flippase GtrA